MEIVIGIDPDSKKHGVAVYIDSVLVELHMMTTPEIISQIVMKYRGDDLLFGIEDVCANSFVYARNRQSSAAAMSKVGLSIGRCQQAQVELMRWLDVYKVRYKLFKPQKGNWAKNKAQFQQATGWDKQSNEDTRAGAFFGFLALNR